jgi:hypothetical protein
MTLQTLTKLRAARFLLLATASAGLAASPRHDYSIPGEDLGDALQAFAEQSGQHIVVPTDRVVGLRSPGLTGRFSEGDALARLLAGSGLHADLIAGAYVVRGDPGSPTAGQADDLVVTGTRIRGAAPIGSSLVVIDRKTIEESGRATVADYLQTLPQNFGGDQNEGNYGINPNAGGNQNYGSSIDLRGLGTTSTLVLFDGNRPALGGEAGSFVDTSLIPSTAIDRIEVLTDGASAIYGTDAVAGVVNVLQDRRKQIDLLPEQTTHSLYAAFDQALADTVSLYARTLYAHRAFSAVFPSRTLSPVTVPATNPFSASAIIVVSRSRSTIAGCRPFLSGLSAAPSFSAGSLSVIPFAIA